MQNRANRLERGIGTSRHPHVIMASEPPSGFEGEVGLFPLFANAAVVDVCRHADDFEIRFGIGTRPDADARAERAASPEVPLHERFVDNRDALAAFCDRPRVPLLEVSSHDNSGAQRGEKSRSDRIQMNVACRDSLIRLDRHGVVPGAAGE